jgi:hypothetical protein
MQDFVAWKGLSPRAMIMVDVNKMGRTFRQNTVADVGLKTGPHKQRFSKKSPPAGSW